MTKLKKKNIFFPVNLKVYSLIGWLAGQSWLVDMTPWNGSYHNIILIWSIQFLNVVLVVETMIALHKSIFRICFPPFTINLFCSCRNNCYTLVQYPVWSPEGSRESPQISMFVITPLFFPWFSTSFTYSLLTKEHVF